MTDLINRSDAITVIIRWLSGEELGADIIDLINSLPSAEQVTGKLKKTCDSLLTDDSDERKEKKSKLDLISRQDAIRKYQEVCNGIKCGECPLLIKVNTEKGSHLITDCKLEAFLHNLPSASVEVDGYTEWLEKLIVDSEMFAWICEDTPCPEWCEENCNYASIQADCLRHLYEVSKGGDSE